LIADLSGVNLKDARLGSELKLTKAILDDADLSLVIWQSLTNEMVDGASFKKANLTSSNLGNMKDFKNVNLTGATMPDGTVHP
jgi:uncharacterized protein YjbI with pentapeptide repeats